MPLCTIIGAGPGLGAALARRFAQADYHIALVGRRRDGLEQIARANSGDDARMKCFPADAGDAMALSAALDAAQGWGGDSDVLIYNAAAMREAPASTLSAAALMADLAVNVGGALTSVLAVLPGMRARRRGTIVFTGGGLALEPYPDWSSLAAGKAALRAYALALHKEVAPDNVHAAVVAICGIIAPGGLFDPDMLAQVYWNIHTAPVGLRPRELIYLPEGADPFYSDPTGAYRTTSQPIRPTAAGQPARSGLPTRFE